MRETQNICGPLFRPSTEINLFFSLNRNQNLHLPEASIQRSQFGDADTVNSRTPYKATIKTLAHLFITLLIEVTLELLFLIVY